VAQTLYRRIRNALAHGTPAISTKGHRGASAWKIIAAINGVERVVEGFAGVIVKTIIAASLVLTIGMPSSDRQPPRTPCRKSTLKLPAPAGAVESSCPPPECGPHIPTTMSQARVSQDCVVSRTALCVLPIDAGVTYVCVRATDQIASDPATIIEFGHLTADHCAPSQAVTPVAAAHALRKPGSACPVVDDARTPERRRPRRPPHPDRNGCWFAPSRLRRHRSKPSDRCCPPDQKVRIRRMHGDDVVVITLAARGDLGAGIRNLGPIRAPVDRFVEVIMSGVTSPVAATPAYRTGGFGMRNRDSDAAGFRRWNRVSARTRRHVIPHPVTGKFQRMPR